MARARRPPQRRTRATRNRSRKTRSLSRRTCCTSCAGCLLSQPTRSRHCRRRRARTACPPACATRSGRRSRTAHSVVLPDLPSLVPQQIAGTGLHTTCRTSLIRRSRARWKARPLPIPFDQLFQHGAASGDCSATLQAAVNILCYSVSSLDTHTVFGKVNVRMLFRFRALRIRTYACHSRSILDRTVVLVFNKRHCHDIQAGRYVYQSVCRKARSRAMCYSSCEAHIPACCSCVCIKG